MEIKINKEIRDYQESVLFGLTLRQFVFAVLAVITAIILYFSLKDALGSETVSWVCILGAFPFAVVGFLKYQGMSAEKFIMCYLECEMLTPKHLVSCQKSYYTYLFDEEVTRHD